MTIAFRSVSGGTIGSNPTLTEPSGAANGDVLLCSVTTGGTASITPPAGWTTELDVAWSAASRRATVYSIVRGSSAPSYAFTTSNPNNDWQIAAYSGCGSTYMDATLASVANATSTTPSSPSITTVTDGAMLICNLKTSGSNTVTVPSGMTSRYFSSGLGAWAELAEPTHGATGSKQWATGSSQITFAWSIALRPPVVAAPLVLGTVAGAGSVTATVSSTALLVPAATHGVATANASVIANALLSVASAGVGVATTNVGAPAAVVLQATHGTATATMTALGPGGAVAFSLTSAGVAVAAAAIKTTMLGSLTAAGAGTAILLLSIKPENPRVKMHGGSASFTQIGGGRVQIAH